VSPRIGALSRGAARVMGSRFAKPVARVVLVALGLVLLAVIGRVSAAGAFGGAPPASILPVAADASPNLGLVALVAAPAMPEAAIIPAPTTSPEAANAPAAESAPSPAPHAGQGSASPDDPVILNSAASEDLRRLPGIGQKRADAILALRARLGRFRAIEDLLKVKGIGRATLKRLRPLVRLDPAPASPSTDAGSPRTAR
jgi:competence protein ComEA